MSLNDWVYVTSDVPFHATWDGIEYELGENPVKVKRGTAELWSNRKGVILSVTLVPIEPIEKQEIVNPLEANGRGEAFAELEQPKKPRKRAKT